MSLNICDRKGNPILKRVLETLYPTRCMSCGLETANVRGLCIDCWKDTHFATGQVCDTCGVPVQESDVAPAFCDQCLHFPPAWDQGRSAVLYQGAGKKLTLLLKHSDRLDLAPEMAKWMCTATRNIMDNETVIAPVPLHRFRLMKRRFNQAAVLAQQIAQISGKRVFVDLLKRTRSTAAQKGMDRSARFENLAGAIELNTARKPDVRGRSVLLVDDVMTTGATLSACAEVCRNAGAKKVNMIVFARVARPE